MTGVSGVALEGVDGVLPESVLFGRWFESVDQCRSLMKSTGAVASGSAVLHALESRARVGSAVRWVPGDVDFYVSRRAVRRGALVQWHAYLVGEGYELCEPVGAAGYSGMEVVKYEDAESGRSVDIVVVNEPLVYILMRFWSTHIMNFATWDGMYCLFPQSVLVRKQMCVVRCRDVRELKAYDKYVGRGFFWGGVDLPDLGEFQSERFVGDDLTYRVVFSGVEVEGRVPMALRSVRFVVRKTGVTIVTSDDMSD
ncbi:hypothetical protein KXX35_010022, partial [Aspergillus fumigatus]